MYKYLVILITPIIFSGCALTTDEIHIPHHKGTNFTMRLPGAEKVTVQVEGEDKRTNALKDRVSVKKNGYGMEMAKIISSNDIAETFSEAITSELESLGFKIGSGGKKVKVELLRFYNDFKIGFFAGDAIADGLVKLIVLSNKGKVLFSHVYEGNGKEPNIQISTGSNARLALIKVMTEIVDKIAEDKDLHAALLQH